MANVKVKVLNAVVDGKTAGSILEIDEKSAAHLASINYVEVLPQETEKKAEQADGEQRQSAPKKPAAKSRKKSDK